MYCIKRRRIFNIKDIKKTFNQEIDEYLEEYKKNNYCAICKNTGFCIYRYFTTEDVCYRCDILTLYRTHLKITYEKIYLSMLNDIYLKFQWYPPKTIRLIEDLLYNIFTNKIPDDIINMLMKYLFYN